MFRDKKVVVVMPAYNAARTLKRTYDEVMEQGMVDQVIVVDDASRDETTAVARTLPNTTVHVHEINSGYGANQKTCYRLALEAGADIVIMVHPDYQYTPRLIPAMVAMIGSGLYPCVLASRILGRHAVRGGMPIWKYFSNRCLDLGGKRHPRHEAFRVPHRLPRLQPETARAAAARRLLGRLRLRQPDARANPLAWRDHCRSKLPHALREGIVFDQLPPQRGLRPGLFANRVDLSPLPLGPDEVAHVPAERGTRRVGQARTADRPTIICLGECGGPSIAARSCPTLQSLIAHSSGSDGITGRGAVRLREIAHQRIRQASR